MQYEVVLDGKVNLRSRDDTICNVDPPFCNLPAGGKLSPKQYSDSKENYKFELRVKGFMIYFCLLETKVWVITGKLPPIPPVFKVIDQLA